jgi:hypothetical protein
MAIEFHCTNCGRLLRVPDDAAGKAAKCPECGGQSNVPVPQVQPEAVIPPSRDAGAGSTPPPLPGGPGQGSPFGPGPAAPPAQVVAWAANRLSGPSIGLIITGILGIVGAVGIMQGAARNQFGIMLPMFHGGFAVPSGAISFALAIIVLIGAIKMKNLESYSFAMAAAIIAMIPCFHSCCGLLGLPFGIWALVVLNDPMVRAAFRS